MMDGRARLVLLRAMQEFVESGECEKEIEKLEDELRMESIKISLNDLLGIFAKARNLAEMEDKHD